MRKSSESLYYTKLPLYLSICPAFSEINWDLQESILFVKQVLGYVWFIMPSLFPLTEGCQVTYYLRPPTSF